MSSRLAGSNFNFERTPETELYCREVVSCLTRYCAKSSDAALRRVNAYWVMRDPSETRTFVSMKSRTTGPWEWRMDFSGTTGPTK
jgi:hypothetical protein